MNHQMQKLLYFCLETQRFLCFFHGSIGLTHGNFSLNWMENGEKWGKTAGFKVVLPLYPIVVGMVAGFSRGKVGNWQGNEDFLLVSAWEWRKKKNMGII